MKPDKPKLATEWPDEARETAPDETPGDADETAQTRTSTAAGSGSRIPEAVPLIDYLDREPSPEDTLLGARFLCREGSMLYPGPSGIGKSSSSTQQDLLWSVGREAFGIMPACALRILVVQAENDDGDIHEMVRGVLDALGFTAEERETCRRNLLIVGEKARTGANFIKEVLAPLLDKHRPDIVRIDPLLAYLGADPTDTARLSEFCRNWINPLLEQYRCACILNHHTPKTTNRDTSKWRVSDWMYSGAGGAELANWARAILVIEPTDNPGAFRFIAAKRGRRIGWRDDLGQPAYERIFCHSEGSIAWRDATSEEAEGIATKKGHGQISDDDLLSYVPAAGTIGKDVLVSKWNARGLGEKKCSARLNAFIEEGVLHEWQEKRSGTRPRKLISMHPQGAGGDTRNDRSNTRTPLRASRQVPGGDRCKQAYSDMPASISTPRADQTPPPGGEDKTPLAAGKISRAHPTASSPPRDDEDASKAASPPPPDAGTRRTYRAVVAKMLRARGGMRAVWLESAVDCNEKAGALTVTFPASLAKQAANHYAKEQAKKFAELWREETGRSVTVTFDPSAPDVASATAATPMTAEDFAQAPGIEAAVEGFAETFNDYPDLAAEQRAAEEYMASDEFDPAIEAELQAAEEAYYDLRRLKPTQ